MIKIQLKNIVIGLLLLALGATALNLLIPNKDQVVEAAELLKAIENIDSVLKLAGADEAVYYETVRYQRTDPSIMEPGDPYHLPILPYYKDDRITEYWVTHQGIAQTTVLASDRSLLLNKVVMDADNISLSNMVNNSIMTISRPDTPSNDTKPDGETNQSFVDGSRVSHWGQPAWIVKFQPQIANPKDYQLLPQKLTRESQNIFAADLQFEQTQWVFEIDQESNFLVSQSLLALTSPEPTVLQSMTMSQPKVVPLAELPDQWKELPLNETTSHTTQSDSSSSDLGAFERSDISKIFSLLPFTTYFPQGNMLDKFTRVSISHNFNRPPSPNSQSFELTDIGVETQGVQLIYIAQTPADPDKPQAIVIMQAPLSQTKLLLENSLPIWQTSEPTQISISGESVTGWMVSQGEMREEGDNPLRGLIFELEETLIYIEGQNVSFDELVALASSFETYR